MKAAADAPTHLAAYVRACADLMGLRDWVLITKVGGINKEHLAECAAVYGQRLATIYLCKKWDQMTPDLLRATVAHELIHCHLAGLDYLMDDVATAGAKKDAARVILAAYNNEREKVTDAVALIIAPYLPLLGSA